MSPTTPPVKSGRLSARAYARHRGCDHKAVTQAIRAGRLTRSVRRGPGGTYSIDPARADLEWTAATYADRVPLFGPTSRDGAESPPELMEARTRLEAAKAQLAEMDLAERRAGVLLAAETEARMAGVFSSCRAALLRIPARLKRLDPTLTRRQLELVRSHILEALSDLASEDRKEDAHGDEG